MKCLHIGICTGTNGLTKAFINNSTEYREINCGEKDLNKKIVEITKTFKPDFVFMQIQCAGIIDINVVKHLKDLGCYIVNWNGDVRDQTPEWMIELGPYVHSCFTNMRDVNYMRSLGFKSDWIEIGYDPEIYCPEGVINTSVMPIVYFGNNTHNFPMSAFRNEMCDFLRLHYPNDFGEYGNGPKAIGNFNGSQLDEAAAYRGAKIAINVSHYEIEKYTSDRMYRILGTGVPMCLAKWYPEISSTGVQGYHFEVWRGLGELKSQIDFFLNKPEYINIYAINGNSLSVELYTFDAMVKNLIKLI